jgi:hypothetical protein
MTQQEIQKMATEIIGDGQSPNKWFVTLSPWIKYYPTPGELDSKLIPGYSEKGTYTEVFDSYEEACEAYDDEELDAGLGRGSVMIEDREIGVVKERWLTERLVIDYYEDEHDDSHFYEK